MPAQTRVLVVDDEERFCKMMQDCLKEEGIQVEYSLCGEEAIKLVKTRKYDAIFLDVVMPGLNGVQTLERIRQFNKDVKIIMITGYSVSELLDRAKKYGAHACLSKPISLSQIKEIIDTKRPGRRKEKKEVRKKCLVIDEGSTAEPPLFTMIQEAGFSLDCATTKQEIKRIGKLNQYELVVLNLQSDSSPCANAFKTQARSIPKERIVFLVDTSEEQEAIENAYQLGSTKYLHRSASNEDFKRMIKEISTQ